MEIKLLFGMGEDTILNQMVSTKVNSDLQEANV